MKTPVLLMLSALVALGHWLLLAAGPATLAQTSVHTSPSDPQTQTALTTATTTPVRVFQARRIESASPAPSATALQTVRTEPRVASPKPRTAEATASLKASEAPAQEAKPELAIALAASGEETAVNKGADSPVAVASAAQKNEVEGVQEVALAPRTLSPPLAAQLISQLQLPKSARLNYDITGQSKGLGYRASGVLDWQQDGSRYDARLVASVFFLGNRVLSSQGEVTADGLAPKRFADKARSEQAAHFEADKGKITFSANTPDALWQRGAQDRLSVFFQLSGMLAGQPERVAPGTLIPVYTASARGADTWAFLVDDVENLSLPAGNMPAIKLTRQSRLEHDQLVEVWFAPAMSYWPVRIKLTQSNGDFVDQQLASMTAP